MKNDAQLAVEAAISMSVLHKQDVIIVRDYETKLAKDKAEDEEVFETIRYVEPFHAIKAYTSRSLVQPMHQDQI